MMHCLAVPLSVFLENGFRKSGRCHTITRFYAPNMAAAHQAIMKIHFVHCRESG
jgi:sRNA-binding regulator protein Hfq